MTQTERLEADIEPVSANEWIIRTARATYSVVRVTTGHYRVLDADGDSLGVGSSFDMALRLILKVEQRAEA